MTVLIRPELFAPTTSAFHPIELTPAQLDLVRDMNRGLSRREFDQFIETSRSMGLNPLKRQICAIILNEGDARKRHVAIVTTIAGLRAIADRTGTYRPDGRAARVTVEESAKHPRANPHGIVDCIVTPYRFSHGRWHRIVGQVWWDEIAPIRTTEDGDKYLDSRTPWPVRPRGQIIKCAEAAALRAGWPENLANVYAEDELDRARTTSLAPSDLADNGKIEREREILQPRGTILVDLLDGNGLVSVPTSSFHDRVSELIQSMKGQNRSQLLQWKDQQRVAFRQFFAHEKSAALDLQRQFEAIEAEAASGATPTMEAANG